jgi:hypothetical protein
MTSVGIIGLGALGEPIAGRPCASAAEVARQSEVIVSLVLLLELAAELRVPLHIASHASRIPMPAWRRGRAIRAFR